MEQRSELCQEQGRVGPPSQTLSLPQRNGDHTHPHHTLIWFAPLLCLAFHTLPLPPGLGQLINAFSVHSRGRQVGRQAGSQDVLVVIKLSLRGPFY